MKIEKTSLDGVFVLEPEFRLTDHRGDTVCAFEEPYGKKLKWQDRQGNTIWFPDNNPFPSFLKHNFSVSRKNVLRGIHVSDCWKLCYCPFGSLRIVAVDCREKKETFGRWQGFAVNDENRKMILVPPMFGLAHLVLSEQAVFYYHWSDSFDGEKQKSYRWNSFDITWIYESPGPILSERDANAPLR
jgi:dTDP-4-dehydrorhamnose 3,5-epimerase